MLYQEQLQHSEACACLTAALLATLGGLDADASAEGNSLAMHVAHNIENLLNSDDNFDPRLCETILRNVPPGLALQHLAYIMAIKAVVHKHHDLARLAIRHLPDIAHLMGAVLDTVPVTSRRVADRVYATFLAGTQAPGVPASIASFFTAHPRLVPQALGFHLSYGARCTLEARQAVANMYRQAFPWLSYVAPPRTAGRRDRIRIGFVSSKLCGGHTVGVMFGGVLRHLGPVFESFYYQLGAPNACACTSVAMEHNMSGFKDTICGWHTTIAADELDVLVYPEVGMDNLLYFLSFARLAPVQVMWWGHTDSAATAIDYFVSSTHFNDTQEQYAEKLVKADALTVILRKPELPRVGSTRKQFRLPLVGRLYMCVQTLIKWGPEFDDVVLGILDRDPDGWIVAIDMFRGHTCQHTILARLQERHPELWERVIFRASWHDDAFLRGCSLATVMLDTFPFSGSRSHLECFAIGKAVVTMDGPSLKHSLCSGVYRALGVRDAPIARSVAEYVDLAVGLATDTDRRERLEAHIVERMEEFYDSPREIRVWNDLLLRLAHAQRALK